MSKPRHQHFILKSCLNDFGKLYEEKKFVECKQQGHGDFDYRIERRTETKRGTRKTKIGST